MIETSFPLPPGTSDQTHCSLPPFTLVYANITEEQPSDASSIVSTMAQMSISFGVGSRGANHSVLHPEYIEFHPLAMINVRRFHQSASPYYEDLLGGGVT